MPLVFSAAVSQAVRRIAQTSSHLAPSHAANMATLGAYSQKHKVTVIGSGNWLSHLLRYREAWSYANN